MELRCEHVELAKIVQGAVESSRPLIESMGHELTVTLPPGSVIVDADPTRLTQVFLNLLNNAAKYTEAAGASTCGLRCRAAMLVVSVIDTGIGIGADKLASIFEMFSQVQGAAPVAGRAGHRPESGKMPGRDARRKRRSQERREQGMGCEFLALLADCR